MYTECAIRDIEIEIGHLNRLTQAVERKRHRMSMLECCRDIIDLHECIGRFVFEFDFDIRSPEFLFRFGQME